MADQYDEIDDSKGNKLDEAYKAQNYDELNKDEINGPIEGVSDCDLKNYANDESVMIDVMDLMDTADEARKRRKAKLHDDWVRYKDVYNCRRTYAAYEGRSKLYLPAARKAVDTLTRIAREALLSDPYMAVETDIQQWQTVGQKFMQDMLERQGKIKQVVPMFLRQLYQLGTSGIELGFKKEVRQIKYRDRASKKIKTRREFTHYGPSYKVVDMPNTYVWPETATDYDNLTLIVKDYTSTPQELRKLADEGVYLADKVEQAIEHHETDLASQNESTSQHAKEMGTEKTFEDEIDITEMWALFQLPDQDCPQWNLITCSGTVVLRVIENPFWFQTPPFLFGAIFREHDFFYGHGIIEMVEMWQYMLNDMANQTMDVGTFCLNPIVTFDPAMIDDPDLIQIEPGAKIPDPNIKFERPPAQMSMEGLNLVRSLLNVIQESSDANALVQGAPREGMGGAAGTATGVSQLFASANAAILDQVEDLEAQVFTPLLYCTEIICHEFMDEQMVMRSVGSDGVVLTERVIEPSDLVLSTDIRWVASLRLREKQAKAQQALNFFNIAIGIPPQLTEAQGFRINYKQLVKNVYSGLGLPGVDDIIEDLVSSIPGIPPSMEVEQIEAGRKVVASNQDTPQNHMEHIKQHMLYAPKSELARVRMHEHIASHMQALQQYEMQQQAVMAKAGAAPGMGQTGPTGGPPLRPQEQPTYATDGAASQGILSQLNGAGS
jgi:hypothetical protein